VGGDALGLRKRKTWTGYESDYAHGAAARVKAHGSAMHFFVVGRVLEQEISIG